MPAAIAIPLIMGAVGTAATVYSANKTANTAKSVGQMQAASANQAGDRSAAAMQQAMDFTRQNMLQTQQSYAPSIQMGNNALSMIGQHTGMPNLGGGGGMSLGGPSGGGMPPSGAGAPAMSPSGGSYNFLQPQPGGQRSMSGPSLTGSGPGTPGTAPPTPGSPDGGISGRQVGEIKQFPNGNRGRWDGQGWVQI